jgi:uncharacterized protein
LLEKCAKNRSSCTIFADKTAVFILSIPTPVIERILIQRIESALQNQKQKIILLFGPRQAGKTTLLRTVATKRGEPYLWLNADEGDIRRMLEEPTSTQLKQLCAPYNLVVIDEAQRVQNRV